MSAELQEILRLVREIHAKAMTGKTVNAGAGSVEPAADDELFSQYGDPEIRKDPPKYKGPSMVGRRYSQATAEWLKAEVGFKHWQYRKDVESNAVDAKGMPKAHWRMKDAQRAAGWLRKVEETAKSSPAPAARPADEWQQQEMEGHDEAF